jgi:hypothetical protein
MLLVGYGRDGVKPLAQAGDDCASGLRSFCRAAVGEPHPAHILSAGEFFGLRPQNDAFKTTWSIYTNELNSVSWVCAR